MASLTKQDRDDLLSSLEGWALLPDREAIHRRFVFDDFNAAFGWMSRVALAAERLNHHPEWRNVYGTVDVVLVTHAADGLTRRDFELAQRMNQYAAGLVKDR